MPQTSPGQRNIPEEFPTIREQDLALIIADWVRMKVNQPLVRPHPLFEGREPDALDLTMIVGELAEGLHPRSLSVILLAVPPTQRWSILRERIEGLLLSKVSTLADYPERELPVF